MKQLLLLYLIFWIADFSYGINSINNQISDTVILRHHLQQITKTAHSRNHQNISTLNSVAKYIYDEFSKYCDTIYYQTYSVNGTEYKNVVGSIGKLNSDKIVIGAHYDVAGEQEGADDNASGVVGLLELARLLSVENLKYRIELVAYTLEEPPYFRTEQMGSYIHAESLSRKGEGIKGMICLEMIGYFSDVPGSQDYPVGLLSLFYGNKGNYITVVQKFGNGRFGREIKRRMKSQNIIRTKSLKAPASLEGMDFSDHLNYWKFGYSAVMITNTAFYRNKNYHHSTDRLETLDLNHMSQVIDEVFLSVKRMK